MFYDGKQIMARVRKVEINQKYLISFDQETEFQWSNVD